MTTLRKESVALLGWTDRRAFTGREERCHVFGNQFGPYLLVVDADLGDAFDEWDERHGERIDFNDERDTLANLDWTDRNTIAEAVDIAMSHGEVRCTGSGTYVYVDPYEWVRSFRTPAEAGRFFRSFGYKPCAADLVQATQDGPHPAIDNARADSLKSARIPRGKD